MTATAPSPIGWSAWQRCARCDNWQNIDLRGETCVACGFDALVPLTDVDLKRRELPVFARHVVKPARSSISA